MSAISDAIIQSAKQLSNAINQLTFSPPITHVYNPLHYAWNAHETYLKKYANNPKQIVFLGMNPGPWGMAQTGIPFGEISFVQNWLGIDLPIDKPPNEHPKRPIQGFQCKKSEVSGYRLWSLFKDRFSTPENFFHNHFVANYCPLIFMESSGRNYTPDQLPKKESQQLFQLCNQHLQDIIHNLSPQWVIGVGHFAQSRAQEALKNHPLKITRIPHPSPANPAANKNWAQQVTNHLINLGIWNSDSLLTANHKSSS